MNDHPEIPPNCPYFGKYNDEIGWRFYWEDSRSQFTWLSCENPYLRYLIASVAYRAWMDEADRIKRTMKPTPVELGIWTDHGKREALEAAEEWREWGKK